MESIPFHERFNKRPRQNLFVVVYRTLYLCIVAITGALYNYFVFGPPHKEWNFMYSISTGTIRRFTEHGKKLKDIDFTALQQQGLKAKPTLLKGFKTKQIHLNPNSNVIEWIKSNQPGEWISSCNDTDIEIPCDWFQENETDEVIFMIHGGAFVGGSSRSHSAMACNIAKKTGISVFSVNYRLAPLNPYPCGLIDVISAYIYLLENYHPKKIVLMGDSAGGGLALSTVIALRDMNEQLPAGIYLLSPWADLTDKKSLGRTPASEMDYLPDMPLPDKRLDDRFHYYCADEFTTLPYVSPFLHHDLDICPVLIQVGTVEKLYPQVHQLARKIAQHGGNLIYEEYDAHVHVFQMFSSQGSKTALERAAKWIRTVISNKTKPVHYFLDFKGNVISERPITLRSFARRRKLPIE